jgi:hypothetical protein
MSEAITFAMRQALTGRQRTLCWLGWFAADGVTSDLYAWTGAHPIVWNGQTWTGAGLVAALSPIEKGETLAHRALRIRLGGLDPDLLGGLDQRVHGRAVKLWLAAVRDDGQIVPDPVLISELVQDTLSLSMEDDGTVTLELDAYEGLPRLGRATATVWSHENQLRAFALDVGFENNSAIGQQREAVEWRQG